VRIILVAYALSPSQGSEPATGWGWATELAQVHTVTVISRESNRTEVESFVRSHPECVLQFKWVPSRSRQGVLGQSRAYIDWLQNVMDTCEVLMEKEQFDLIHLVSYGTISAPAPFWKLGLPFILGPIGGGQMVDVRFQEVLGMLPLDLRFRNARIRLLPYLPSIRNTIQRASLVLATNRETAELVKRCGGSPLLFNATGLRSEFIRNDAPIRIRSKGFKMLWTGRMLYRKALPLAFYALKQTGRRDFTLDLVGDGPMAGAWQRLVKSLQIDNQVNFHGKVPFAEVFNFYDNADLFVFPSVSDAFGSQLLEAAARGLPILTLNHQGVDVLVPEGVAWKVPVDSIKNIIERMAEAMVLLADSPEQLSRMSEAAIRYAHSESWPRRVERMSSLYTQVVSDCSAVRRLSDD
jgi:glycosyltransferase involved in cell wall biosynthesis